MDPVLIWAFKRTIRSLREAYLASLKLISTSPFIASKTSAETLSAIPQSMLQEIWNLAQTGVKNWTHLSRIFELVQVPLSIREQIQSFLETASTDRLLELSEGAPYNVWGSYFRHVTVTPHFARIYRQRMTELMVLAASDSRAVPLLRHLKLQIFELPQLLFNDPGLIHWLYRNDFGESVGFSQFKKFVGTPAFESWMRSMIHTVSHERPELVEGHESARILSPEARILFYVMLNVKYRISDQDLLRLAGSPAGATGIIQYFWDFNSTRPRDVLDRAFRVLRGSELDLRQIENSLHSALTKIERQHSPLTQIDYQNLIQAVSSAFSSRADISKRVSILKGILHSAGERTGFPLEFLLDQVPSSLRSELVHTWLELRPDKREMGMKQGWIWVLRQQNRERLLLDLRNSDRGNRAYYHFFTSEEKGLLETHEGRDQILRRFENEVGTQLPAEVSPTRGLLSRCVSLLTGGRW